mgnify:CR=1 FL=1
MATDPERGLLVNANHLTTHNGSYVTVQPGQQCACGCCEEWYIFTRDDAHFQHWEQTTDDLSTLCNNTNLLCYDDLSTRKKDQTIEAYVAFVTSEEATSIPAVGRDQSSITFLGISKSTSQELGGRFTTDGPEPCIRER